MSPLNISQKLSSCSESIKNCYTNHIKPAISSGIQYTKDLKSDVVDFATQNPKKVGGYAAGVLFGVSLVALIAKLVKNNKKMHEISAIKSEHIEHQREIINALKEDIELKQCIIDAQHEGLEAAHKACKKHK